MLAQIVMENSDQCVVERPRVTYSPPLRGLACATDPTATDSVIRRLVFWLSVGLLFFIANVTVSHYDSFVTKYVSHYRPRALGKLNVDLLVPLRAFFFFWALMALVGLFVTPTVRKYRAMLWDPKALWRALIIYAVFVCLSPQICLSGMGHDYATNGLDPSNLEPDNTYYGTYRRILMPAIAYYTQFRGPFLYNVLDVLLTLGFIYLVVLFVQKRLASWNIFQLLSLLSAGLVIHQFFFPGFVDKIVLSLAILSLLLPFSSYGRSALLALAMLTHETTGPFIMGPIILALYPRREIARHTLIIALFCIAFLMEFHFSISAATQLNSSVCYVSVAQLIGTHRLYALLGTFFAYKFLWIFFIWAVVICISARRWGDLATLALIVLGPVALVGIGTDTSRFVTYGNLGILLAAAIVFQRARPWLFNLILAVNLLLPSCYVAVNEGGGVRNFQGIYEWIWHAMGFR
jgi:hypothetical protein